jgi:biopolymer transport protein ExbB
MNLTTRFLSLTLLGAEWVLWLLIGLSVISIAIMVERAWYFFSHQLDVDALAADLRRLIGKGQIAEARARVSARRTVEETVVHAGLAEVDRGVDAVGEAMLASKAANRMGLERNLAVLGTLGNNTPFIGLFGTVLGIIKASHDLAGSQAAGGAAANAVMAGVFEALVATAVGLMVAIPAVIGFNYFNRHVRQHISNVDSLAHTVLAQLKGKDAAEQVTVAKEKPSLSEVK